MSFLEQDRALIVWEGETFLFFLKQQMTSKDVQFTA